MKKLLATKPFAFGCLAPHLKCGKLRLTKPSGVLEPLTVCCPTAAIIWQILRLEPLEPHTDIIRGELYHGKFFIHIWPAVSRTVDKVLFTPAGAGSDVVPDLNDFADEQKEGTAVLNNLSIRASKPFQDIQHLDGYYIIQITGIPSIDLSLTPSQQISAIVSKYYTAGTYLIMEGGAGSFSYTHRGEHFYLQDLNVKIMESDGTSPTKLGNNNTIFLEINRANNLLQF